MPRQVSEYLQHILDEIEYLTKTVDGIEKTEFLSNETLKRAFVRSIEVIGEAVKQVPDHIREKYSEIDWRAMAGMRDRLIHGYFGVDYEVVWDVVASKIQTLKPQIQTILKSEPRNS
jgi:uncharacterized protein with HEPN domain